MVAKKQIKVVELNGMKLHKNAKYIFLLNPMYINEYEDTWSQLANLIGEDRFALLLLDKSDFTAIEVLPNTSTTNKEINNE